MFNVFEQLIDTLTKPASNDAEAVDACVQHFRLFLPGLEHFVLDTCNHVADGIYRAVHLIEGVGIFFLYHVAHLSGIFFSWCKHIGQSLEEALLFMVYGVRIVMGNDFSSYMRCAEQGILLGNQTVQLFLINLVGWGVPHGLQYGIHVPLLVPQQGSYRIQTSLLQSVGQNDFQCINRSIYLFHGFQVMMVFV